MKIKIEGCTTEQLVDCSPYLTLGKEYEAEVVDGCLASIIDDDGDDIKVLVRPEGCAFLPEPGKWVKVE